MRGRGIIAAALLCASSAAAAADEQPICADRPGKSTPACTVPAGHWQIETGLADWSLQKAGGERDNSLVLGETTIKYGLTDRSDIEIDVTPWQRATSRGPGFRESASGIGDIEVIMKQELTSPDAALQVTLYPYVKIPTAKHSLGNGKWEGGLLVPIDYAIGKSPFSIELTPEVDWVADADGRGHHAGMVQVVPDSVRVLSYELPDHSIPCCGITFHSLHATSQALQPTQTEVSVKKPTRSFASGPYVSSALIRNPP